MGVRLKGFDYSRPYFYMVTIKRRAGYPAFGRVVGDAAVHYLECNAITYLFIDIIKTFHEKWSCLEPIDCFAIMPDHIHLLMKLQAVGKPVSLATLVWQLERQLEKAFFANFRPGAFLADGAANGATDRFLADGAANGNTGRFLADGAANGNTGRFSADGAANGATGRFLADGAANGTTGRFLADGAANGATGRFLADGAADGTTGRFLADGAANGATGRFLADGAADGATDRTGTGGGCAVDRPVGQHLFESEWHDWIVSKRGQLAAFKRYIRENAERSWRRQSHRAYFQRVNALSFLGRQWYGYGNAALLELPVIEPFKCSRRWVEGGSEWQEALTRASRLGPGGAGISTFMSPCEKACGHALGLAGGRWIVLSPEGFGERWHPGREYEKFCAEGRMLFLSLWPAMAREPTKKELYDRCHEMGDLVVEGLSTRN